MATSPGRGAHATTRRQRHPWPHRLLVAANVFLGVCIFASAAAYGYLKLKLGDLERIEFSCSVLRHCGDDDPDEPMNVLLVGSDTRAEITEEERIKFGTTADVAGERTDTMMILHIDPRAEKAAVLSIPRDLYVPIAGTSRTDRINTAYGKQPAVTTRTTRARAGQTTTTIATGLKDGPERLIATIRQSLGIEIDHYVQVDFNGFRAITKAVGGVTVPFPAPARDKLAGLDIKQAGCVSLSGDQALSYVRSRNFQYLEAGRWRKEPTGDIGRIQRQQDFIRRMLGKAISRDLLNPLRLNALVNAGLKNVKLDAALSTKDMLRIGARFRSLAPEAVEMLTLPADNVRVRGAAVLKLRSSEAQIMVERFNATTSAADQTGPPPSIPPGGVRVRVLNGSGVPGQAGQAMRKLTAVGFGNGGIGDAGGFGHTVTEIRYGAGQLAKAQLLKAWISGTSTLVSDPKLRGGDVVLIVGVALYRYPHDAGAGQRVDRVDRGTGHDLDDQGRTARAQGRGRAQLLTPGHASTMGGHGHSHGAAEQRAGARYAGRLSWALVLVGIVFVAEAVGGLLLGSLALLSDAGHMLTDVVGLGMALAAIHLANRAATRRGRSFGLYRLEILAALANAVLLFGVAGYVLYEAVRRLDDAPDVSAGPVLAVAAVGLVANLLAFFWLRPGAAESLNVQGAYLEVLADLIGSAAVIAAACVIAVTGWAWVDPVAGALLGLWILPRTWRLARHALRILLQAAPPNIDLAAVERDLAALPGVVDVHDVHVWTLTSEMDVASAHVMVAAGVDSHAVLDQARARARGAIPTHARHSPDRARRPHRLRGGQLVTPTWKQWVAMVVAAAFVAGSLGYAFGSREDEAPTDGSVDVGFLHDMIAHHEQAVRMSNLENMKSTEDSVKVFAREIAQQQSYEIGVMERQLEIWGFSRGS